jgi:hypothetical protein
MLLAAEIFFCLDTTTTFVNVPACLAIALISTIPSATSGISILINSLTKLASARERTTGHESVTFTTFFK